MWNLTVWLMGYVQVGIVAAPVYNVQCTMYNNVLYLQVWQAAVLGVPQLPRKEPSLPASSVGRCITFYLGCYVPVSIQQCTMYNLGDEEEARIVLMYNVQCTMYS